MIANGVLELQRCRADGGGIDLAHLRRARTRSAEAEGVGGISQGGGEDTMKSGACGGIPLGASADRRRRSMLRSTESEQLPELQYSASRGSLDGEMVVVNKKPLAVNRVHVRLVCTRPPGFPYRIHTRCTTNYRALTGLC